MRAVILLAFAVSAEAMKAQFLICHNFKGYMKRSAFDTPINRGLKRFSNLGVGSEGPVALRKKRCELGRPSRELDSSATRPTEP